MFNLRTDYVIYCLVIKTAFIRVFFLYLWQTTFFVCLQNTVIKSKHGFSPPPTYSFAKTFNNQFLKKENEFLRPKKNWTPFFIRIRNHDSKNQPNHRVISRFLKVMLRAFISDFEFIGNSFNLMRYVLKSIHQ